MTELNESRKCLRCGKCCYYEDDNGIKRKCRHLVRLKNSTLCRVYNFRLDREIDIGVYCVERKYDERVFEGCPLNPISKLK